MSSLGVSLLTKWRLPLYFPIGWLSVSPFFPQLVFLNRVLEETILPFLCYHLKGFPTTRVELSNPRNTHTLIQELNLLFSSLTSNAHLLICIEDNWCNKSRICTYSDTNINVMMSGKRNRAWQIIGHLLAMEIERNKPTIIERLRERTSPWFFAKIEHGQNSSKLRMPICLYV